MADGPELLYHYTTAQGLLGILRSNALWATDLNYMNDFSELNYAWKLIDTEWTKIAGSNSKLTPPDLENPFRDTILRFTEFIKPSGAFAVCFCENEDQLSQWRAYAEKGTGYSLGFNKNRLRQGPLGINGLKEIDYDPDTQMKTIKSVLETYIRENQKLIQASDHPTQQSKMMNVLGEVFRSLYPNFFFYKDPVFKEEKEWRHIDIRDLKDEVPDLNFREMKGTVVPYIETRFSPMEPGKKNRLPLVEIIQGPLVDPSLGERSLGLLLKKYGYDDVQVRRSKVPIRF